VSENINKKLKKI